MEHAKFNEFVAALREFELPGAALVVATSNVTKHGEVKLSIANRGYSSRLVTEGPGRKYHQYWPFIDIFFYTVNISSSTGEEQIVELDLRASDEAGTLVRNPRGGADWPFSTFFPARTYMFGGLRVPGPSLQVATPVQVATLQEVAQQPPPRPQASLARHASRLLPIGVAPPAAIHAPSALHLRCRQF